MNLPPHASPRPKEGANEIFAATSEKAKQRKGGGKLEGRKEAN